MNSSGAKINAIGNNNTETVLSLFFASHKYKYKPSLQNCSASWHWLWEDQNKRKAQSFGWCLLLDWFLLSNWKNDVKRNFIWEMRNMQCVVRISQNQINDVHFAEIWRMNRWRKMKNKNSSWNVFTLKFTSQCWYSELVSRVHRPLAGIKGALMKCTTVTWTQLCHLFHINMLQRERKKLKRNKLSYFVIHQFTINSVFLGLWFSFNHGIGKQWIN